MRVSSPNADVICVFCLYGRRLGPLTILRPDGDVDGKKPGQGRMAGYTPGIKWEDRRPERKRINVINYQMRIALPSSNLNAAEVALI